MRLTTSVLALLPSLVAAGRVADYPGMQTLWSDTFAGSAGAPVDQSHWNVADVKMNNGNNELETYSPNSRNVQLSGGQTLQLVPWKDPSAASGWTSGRIESKASWVPAPGKVTKVEALIGMGNNANKAGIWPAFWMLGDAIRTGTSWPACGELDILEQKNGAPTAFGTAHCAACSEPMGRVGTTTLPDSAPHTWTLTWDRTPGSWQQETITWLRDGQAFHTITGSQFDQGTWSTLAHSPYYIILNVAVGGAFPGNPDGATQDGYGSMMEVWYVAVYQS